MNSLRGRGGRGPGWCRRSGIRAMLSSSASCNLEVEDIRKGYELLGRMGRHRLSGPLHRLVVVLGHADAEIRARGTHLEEETAR
jgi:hypothetical protein